MTTIYLAMSPSGSAIGTLKRLQGRQFSLSMLLSYAYIQLADKYPWWFGMFERHMLDSGAFSAWQSGHTVDIDALIVETRKRRWDEAVALDVIGDGPGSLKNARYMKRRGSRAFPVFHYGEPLTLLETYCKEFSKVGLSCRFGESITLSLRWLDRCFTRCYPHRFHSFGWIDRKTLERFPFHSADASSWALGPSAFGNWKTYGRLHGIVGKAADLTVEIERTEEMQKYLRWRWRKELARMGEEAA